MIIRILHEGQYDLRGADLDALNDVDNALVEAIARRDEGRYRELMTKMHALIRTHGTPVPMDEFVESDIILPPSDASMDEVEELFAGEGIVPG
jgi:hypothetical protein